MAVAFPMINCHLIRLPRFLPMLVTKLPDLEKRTWESNPIPAVFKQGMQLKFMKKVQL